MSSSSSVPQDWMSLYIPVVPSDLCIGGLLMNNEMSFQYYFEHMLPMGKVARVDFITRPAKVGNHSVTSAFVHFSAWFDQSPVYKDISSMLHSEEQVRLTGGKGLDGLNVDFVSSNNSATRRFINVKINKAPIQRIAEIPKNIHQIINNYGVMEGVISDQNARIDELSALVERLRQTILEIESSEGPVPAVVEQEDAGPMQLAELA